MSGRKSAGSKSGGRKKVFCTKWGTLVKRHKGNLVAASKEYQSAARAKACAKRERSRSGSKSAGGRKKAK